MVRNIRIPFAIFFAFAVLFEFDLGRCAICKFRICEVVRDSSLFFIYYSMNVHNAPS
jgi:hypothetical protein